MTRRGRAVPGVPAGRRAARTRPGPPGAVAALLAALILAGAACARDVERMRTPHGPVVAGGEWGAPTLRVAGRPVGGVDGHGSIDLLERLGSLVLVGLHSGGTACPTVLARIDTRPGRVGLTEALGTCSPLYDLAWDDETVTVTILPMRVGEGAVAFSYDGRTIREAALAPPPSGRPPGGDPAAWIGAHPSELIGAPDWAPILEALMGAEALAAARSSMMVSAGMERQGAWVAGRACRAHMCSEAYGAVALSLEDGRPLVALRDGGPPRLWGEPRGPLPGAVASVMAGG